MESGIQNVIALKVYIDLLCTRGLNCQGGTDRYGCVWGEGKDIFFYDCEVLSSRAGKHYVNKQVKVLFKFTSKLSKKKSVH